MAKITPVQSSEAFVQHTPAATASGGDEIQPLSNSKSHLILFDNTAVGAVTATITVANTSLTLPGIGKVTKADLGLSIPAGEQRSVLLTGSVLSNYLDGSAEVPITYTSHDVGLLISVIAVE